MKQITVKTVEQALAWIDTNAHHKAEIEGHEFGVKPGYTHQTLSNYHERMRIPVAIHQQMIDLIEPNKREFDSRMFALTRKGRIRLNRFRKDNQAKKELEIFV